MNADIQIWPSSKNRAALMFATAAGASALETALEAAADGVSHSAAGFAEGCRDVCAMPAHGIQEAIRAISHDLRDQAADAGRGAAAVVARSAAPGVSEMLAEKGDAA